MLICYVRTNVCMYVLNWQTEFPVCCLDLLVWFSFQVVQQGLFSTESAADFLLANRAIHFAWDSKFLRTFLNVSFSYSVANQSQHHLFLTLTSISAVWIFCRTMLPLTMIITFKFLVERISFYTVGYCEYHGPCIDDDDCACTEATTHFLSLRLMR